MSIFDNDAAATGTGALSGAGTGALIGSVIPGIGTGIGAGAGALVGGLTGWLGSHGSHSAEQKQQASMDAAMKRLQAFSQQQYANRMNDLNQTMQFYGPSQSYLQSIYTQGQGTQAPQTSPVAMPTAQSKSPFDGLLRR